MIDSIAVQVPALSTPTYKSPLRYPGGKQKAIEQIARRMPQRANEFREPLVGGGSVFFHAKTIGFSKEYWINDKFYELTAFWKSVQDAETCGRLLIELEELRTRFQSAEEIKEFFLSVKDEKSDSDYRAAFLFFFFNRVTFSGTTHAGGFSAAASIKRFTASSVERLKPMPAALRGTRITNLDFAEVIDAPGTDVFMFIDPPYFKASRLYGKGSRKDVFDHERLANTLKETKHKFLITYDDCEEVRNLFGWANVQDWQLQYGMNNCNATHESKIGNEVFITNY
ncbi:MAG: DNA adenine methylase [Candidatus Melainabacteria bacterium]|nr:DNA adenine methylase [Candidatus Melainabacteria bacterium]